MSRTEHTLATLLRAALAIAGAILLIYAGHDMRQLQSEAGGTVAEEFDHAVGLLCYGLAFGLLALSIPTVFTRSTGRGDDDYEEDDDDAVGGDS